MEQDDEFEVEIIYRDDFKMDVITETELELIGEYLPDILREVMTRIPLDGEQ